MQPSEQTPASTGLTQSSVQTTLTLTQTQYHSHHVKTLGFAIICTHCDTNTAEGFSLLVCCGCCICIYNFLRAWKQSQMIHLRIHLLPLGIYKTLSLIIHSQCLWDIVFPLVVVQLGLDIQASADVYFPHTASHYQILSSVCSDSPNLQQEWHLHQSFILLIFNLLTSLICLSVCAVVTNLIGLISFWQAMLDFGHQFLLSSNTNCIISHHRTLLFLSSAGNKDWNLNAVVHNTEIHTQSAFLGKVQWFEKVSVLCSQCTGFQ